MAFGGVTPSKPFRCWENEEVCIGIEVLDAETLESFDHVIWRGSGHAAAAALNRSQSAVNRHTREVQRLFVLELQRKAGDWQVFGDVSLLLLEREVHQRFRLRRGRGLRLEAAYWWRDVLEASPPPGWSNGVFNLPGPRRPVQLLKDRVIDAWVYADPDLPDHDPELVVLRFSEAAIQLIADSRHPLQQQSGLQLADTGAFPTLALPDELVPEAARAFRALGLWATPSRMARYDVDRWEGLCEDEVTIGYGFGLSLEVQPGLRPLPLALPMRTSDALILRRDVADQLPFGALLADLRRRTAHHGLGPLDYQLIDSPD